MDDVEAAVLERQAHVRPDADRDAEARPPGDLNCRADRDHVGVLTARERTTPSVADYVAGAAGNFDAAADYTWPLVKTTGGIAGFDAA